VINEIAQWAVLLFLSVFILGLTRHLGQSLMPPRQQYAHDQGPALGAVVPATLLDDREQGVIKRLIVERAHSFAVLLMVHDTCPACTELISSLERGVFDEELSGAPIVAITRSSERRHVDSLRAVADLAVVDPHRFEAGDFRFTPFIMIVDGNLTVVHKDLSADVGSAVRRWRPLEESTFEPVAVTEVGA
jgi:hypothetical protein